VKDGTSEVKDFQESLENNRKSVLTRRQELYKSSGRFVPDNRKKWLKIAVTQRRDSRRVS